MTTRLGTLICFALCGAVAGQSGGRGEAFLGYTYFTGADNTIVCRGETRLLSLITRVVNTKMAFCDTLECSEILPQGNHH